MEDNSSTTGIVKREPPPQIHPIIPKSFSEIVIMAKILAATEMVPKQFRNKPDDVAVTIQAGMEIGLPAMQSLQSIACINGRPSLWGDTILALCYASGKLEWIQEFQDADLSMASCEVKRKGNPHTVKATFTQADAKRAGLWGKAGPWTQYPKLMLKNRARIALRDAFPDVLRGMASAEEQRDIIDIQVVPVKEQKEFEATPRKHEKDNLDALKNDETQKENNAEPESVNGYHISDERAVPPDDLDDIPIDKVDGHNLIDEHEFSDFLEKSRGLNITTKSLVEYVKGRGFSEASKITKDKYKSILEGLEGVKK